MNTQNNTPASRNEEARSLHNQIMNLSAPMDPKIPADAGVMLAYKIGHRDARHAAAEIALAAPGAAIDAREQEAPELLLGWKRYEKARKLSPFQWNRLHIRNLAGENFDEMIDSLPEPSTPFPAPSEALSPATVAQPVAEIVTFGYLDGQKEVSWSKGKMPPVGTKLYAQPCASQGCGGADLPAMPDLRYHAEYRRGFASCLDEFKRMRAAALSTAKSGGGATPEGGGE